MKRTLFAILIITCLCALADVPTKFYLWAGGEYTECSVEEDCVEFSGDIITAKGKEYQRTAVDSITFAEPVVASEEEETTEEDDTSNTVYVTYAGSTASVECDIEGVTYTVDGADVTLTNTITDTEITVELTGQSSSGSLVYTASYKTTVRLNGLTLTGSSAEAINVKCGKRIALVLADGTTNTLADCAEDGGQKAAFYTKGHLEVSGGGTLNVVGNVKHGLCSKEYMLVKKTVGTINITSAAKDGIHAGEYVQINGGTLSVSGVGDDGIQAELADDGEEDDGCIIVKGGEVSVKTTGSGAKALKADTDINIKGGTLNVTQTGGYDVDDDGSASYTTALKAEGDINITGGTISITTSGTAAKGLSADGNVSISEDDATTSIVINNTGAGELFDGTASGSSTGSYKVYVSLPTSSSGGGGNSSSYWTNVYLYNSSGTKVATLTNTVTLSYTSSSMWGGSSTTSKTFYYYDFGAADSGTYYFGSDDYTSSSGGGFGGGNSSTTYTIKSSTFTGPTSGSDVYYTMSSGTKSGSTYTFSLTDATSTWASATTSSTTSSETVTATGIKSDGNTAITAGTVSITMTGAGGKGIKTNGTFAMGDEATGDGPTLTVKTTGASITTSSSSSSNQGNGMNNQDDESTGSDAKAIKAMGNAYVYGGSLTVTTATDGAEGLESKANIYIAGGQNYLYCYDDCINASGNIYFNGGVTVAHSTGNDAVDSNAGVKGAITIGDGIVLAYTSCSNSVEEGLDCDDNSYIQVTGTGIALSMGGVQGGTLSTSLSSATQAYAFYTSSYSFTAARYYSLCNASGTPLVTWKLGSAVSSSLAFFTAPGLTSKSTCYVKYSTSAPASYSTLFNGLYLDPSYSASLSTGFSMTAK